MKPLAQRGLPVRLVPLAAAVLLGHAALLDRVEPAPAQAPAALARAVVQPVVQVAAPRAEAHPEAVPMHEPVHERRHEPIPERPRIAAAPLRLAVFRPAEAAFEERPMLIKTNDGALPASVEHAGAQSHEPAEPLLAQAAAPAPTPAAATLPTYRTKPPAAATLVYRLSRGPIVGSGEIVWQPAAGAYSLQLEGRVPIVGTLITQISRGRLDATGLVPERFTDRRLRRAEQAANFDRTTGLIGFSGQAPELPVTPGVQDRVSVMIQLAAIVNAWARTPPVGEHLWLRVVGARGDAHVWSMRYEGPQTIDTPDGRIPALRFLREPEEPQDTRAEFWLDPARQFLPVKVVLTDGKSEPFELLRTR